MGDDLIAVPLLDVRPYAETAGDPRWIVSDLGADVRPGIFEDIVQQVERPVSAGVGEWIQRQRRLAQHSDAELFAGPLRSAPDLVCTLPESLGLPTGDVADALFPVIRDLVSRGFLTPVASTAGSTGRAR